jgi:outer membrane lipoprotein SlyB
MRQSIYASFIVLVSLLLTACNPDSNPTASEETATTSQPQAAQSCPNCGTVAAITPVTVEGESSGAGAVIGAVVGGLLGNQVGGGSGRDAATAVGAIGGAVAGKEIEERKNARTYYEVAVNLDNGGRETVNVASPRGISVGTEVEIVGNDLRVR